MSEQQVPWALERRALLWSPDGWNEAEAFLCDVHGECYQAWELRFGASTGEPIEAIYARTALLPNQCPGCFATDCADSPEGHEDGCRVAESLARGVSAFWAPFVHRTFPPGEALAHWISSSGNLKGPTTPMGLAPKDWGWVCLRPEGPTRAPWESE